MSYFTAVVSRDGARWVGHDVDVEGLEDVNELAAVVRGLAVDEEPSLLLVEREDAWWAVVRVDADEDPRVFVSDLRAATVSPYAKVLDLDEPDEDDPPEPATPYGDTDLLVDLGTSPETLLEMCEEEWLPMDALAALGEAGGFGETLDSLR